jgi:O-antigen/teichoic acid export membrane protein
VMLVVDVALVPHHGAFGAAIGLTSAVVANNVVPLAQVSRGLGLHPFGRATLAAMGLSTGCFAAPPVFLHFSAHAGLTAHLAATAAGSAAYLLGVSRLRAIFTQGAR